MRSHTRATAFDCCVRRLILRTGMRLPRSQNPLLCSTPSKSSLSLYVTRKNYVSSHRASPIAGAKTPVPEDAQGQVPKSLFYFDTGYALFAKRPSRPFPPPFHSRPSGSFSDPLTTHDQSRDRRTHVDGAHDQSRDRRSYVNGEMIRGVTNGDDAVLVSENFIGANDGVGAWATREKGHAA